MAGLRFMLRGVSKSVRQFCHLQNPRRLVNKPGGILCKYETSKLCKATFHVENVDPSIQYSVHTDELEQILSENKVFVIDVRSEKETIDGKMTTQNWVNIPLDEIDNALKLPQKDYLVKYGIPKPNKYSDDVVFYCQGGRRSLAALQTALDQGYFRAKHYPHGWMGWVNRTK